MTSSQHTGISPLDLEGRAAERRGKKEVICLIYTRLLFDRVRIQADASLWETSALNDTPYIRSRPQREKVMKEGNPTLIQSRDETQH